MKFLERCDSPNKRYSCHNGTCVSDEKACDLVGHTSFIKGKPKDRTTCKDPSLYRKCPDGYCRVSCDGDASSRCPLSLPIQCPQGTCGAVTSFCTWINRCSSVKPFQCADMSCVKDIELCPRSYGWANGARIQFDYIYDPNN